MDVILAEIVDQFLAVLYKATNDEGTYIDPKYPKYVEFNIGVLKNTLEPNVATEDPNKIRLSRFLHDENA